jgi:hypothetical protein
MTSRANKEQRWNYINSGKLNNSEKNLSVILSITNPILLPWERTQVPAVRSLCYARPHLILLDLKITNHAVPHCAVSLFSSDILLITLQTLSGTKIPVLCTGIFVPDKVMYRREYAVNDYRKNNNC